MKNNNDVYEHILSIDKNLGNKINFVNHNNIAYRYVIYSYKPESIYVYRVIDSEFVLKKKYNSFKDFGLDLKKLTDINVHSPLQTREMPLIDITMRRLGTPWPVNLDSIFFTDDECLMPGGIIEYQTTIKQSVREHCNNRWWKPIGNRKGDKGRWQVLNTLSQNLNLPIYIVVWSPDDVNGDIKFKLVEQIDDYGIKYKFKKTINYNEYSRPLKDLFEIKAID